MCMSFLNNSRAFGAAGTIAFDLNG
jgi:hypothetical protein